MSEKSHKRKLRSDHSSSQSDVEVSSFSIEEYIHLSDQVLEDNSNQIENKISKRLGDAEFGQREIFRKFIV